MAKFLGNAWGWVVAASGRGPARWALVAASWSAVAAAETQHVDNRCARLSDAEYEELDARILLLLRAESEARPPPAVVCTAQGAWLEWQGRRIPIVGRAPLVEEVVDLVEGQLHGEQRATEADPKTTEDAAVAAGQPMLERGAGTAPPLPAAGQPADRVALRPVDARGGGIAFGIETELPSDTIDAAVGPVFDFAASVGPLLLGGREAVRFTLSGRRVSYMDFQGLIAYGAPFDPDKRFGVVVRAGPEWMVAYPEGNSGQAAVVPVTDIGLRVAHHFGSVGVWLGVDAHVRLDDLSLRSKSALIANDVGGSFTLGAAFVDWSRK